MSYAADITRKNPTAFLFLVDQSGSMAEAWSDGRPKSQAVSDALNRILAEIITKCSKDEGVRNYFDIGVIGYGGSTYINALPGSSERLLKPVSELEASPLRVETRAMKVPDGAGGLVETSVKFPVWFDPTASGGTPMVAALRYAAEQVGVWCDAHPDAFPPAVIHITDGESNDGDPEQIAELLRQLTTSDGNVLLFNLHISNATAGKVVFPESESALGSSDARRLFRMSSVLPPIMQQAAQSKGYEIGTNSRGYGYNADFTDLVNFFDIGTRPANLAR